MQTFVPSTNFRHSAIILDKQRLGKQRVEAYQILIALGDEWALDNAKKPAGFKSRWANHPAVRMWRGHEEALRLYMNACICEWKARGCVNNMKLAPTNLRFSFPSWWNGPIHASHRAALLAKNLEFYRQYNWAENPEIKYHWPC